MRYEAALALGCICWSAVAGAQDLRRATIWDLKLGQPVSAQPAMPDFSSTL